MPERSHLSIGEVLSLLRDEFPDVTISKIRFLESQGLVDPERTPSGYRKFYEQDVERLRWILRQQREHFLPLKVIRGRLTEGGAEEHNGTGIHSSESAFDPGDRAEAAHLPGLAPPATPPRGSPGQKARTEVVSREAIPQWEEPGPEPAEQEARAHRQPVATRSEPALPSPVQASPRVVTHRTGEPEQARSHTGEPRSTSPTRAPEQRAPAGQPARSARGGDRESESYSAEELVSAAGAPAELINELKQYGLITVHTVVAGTPYFDETALAVTRAAVGFARHGVEARHLRAWRNSADREAALFEQLIMPLLRQRNPQARRQAADTVSDLSQLGAELRDALLQRALRDIR